MSLFSQQNQVCNFSTLSGPLTDVPHHPAEMLGNPSTLYLCSASMSWVPFHISVYSKEEESYIIVMA